MSCGDQATDILPEPARGKSFLAAFCLSSLRSCQNPDGGWGFQIGLESRVEPTCWARLALAHHPAMRLPALDRPAGGWRGQAAGEAEAWLSRAQLPDGSWPAARGLESGCWVTALASLALGARPRAGEAAARGLEWILNAWPAEGQLGRRMARWLFRGPNLVEQNCRLRGWSWTPATASWVEPTAYSLILLANVPKEMRTALSEKRRQLGEAMLYDRMCSSGGWNSGNPLVYGIEGIPRIVPTAWALLALRNGAARSENQKSLDWLARSYHAIEGPGSLALAHLCLKTFGRPAPALEPRLERMFSRNRFFGNVVVMAWAILALKGVPEWLGGMGKSKL